MIINRLRMPIPVARELEDNAATVTKAQADIDYVAMMCDVDIPTEDAKTEDNGNVSED